MSHHQAILLATLAGALACAGRASTGDDTGPQQFTRQLSATPAQVVAATVETFADYEIPVATANEVEGEVRSGPITIASGGAYSPESDRVVCSAAAVAGEEGRAPRMSLTVRTQRADGGSRVQLSAEGPCNLTSGFITELLDQIEERATNR
ncbi:MAG TPA: hypothetical protein VNK43_07715 [Gemmatimonadales bacterium]|nr:hypothetical protein [Gemmatimonadales bacterium]